jgi:hypothetical protein
VCADARGRLLVHGPTKRRPCRIDCTAQSPCIRLPQGHCQEHVEINRLFHRAPVASRCLPSLALQNVQSAALFVTNILSATGWFAHSFCNLSVFKVCPHYYCLFSSSDLCICFKCGRFHEREPQQHYLLQPSAQEAQHRVDTSKRGSLKLAKAHFDLDI